MRALVLAVSLAAAAPDSSLAPLATLDNGPAEAPHVVEPSGLATDAFGRLYVTDAARHTLQRWDAAGHWLDGTGALGSDPSQFRRPGALTRLGSLGVAVLDVENRRIVSYDLHLRLLGVLVDLRADDLESSIGTVTPVSLAADRGGALYVADADRERVLEFDFAGAFRREIGGPGASAGGFSGLSAIAVGPRGELVTAERSRAVSKRAAADSTSRPRSRVQAFDAGGHVAWTLSVPWSAGGAGGPVAMAVDDSMRVALANERSGELVVMSRDGQRVAQGSGLLAPRALAFAPDGSLWVAEAGGARVRRLSLAAAAGP